MAEKNETLKKALQVAKADDNLTVSMGIAFAKAGYPAHAMIDLAEALLKNAKALRKKKLWARQSEAGNKGCIDWHWNESSLSETLGEARSKSWFYVSNNRVMVLSSRPWTVDQCGKFTEAAKILHQLPRRKREQLETILRLGLIQSSLAWEAWWKGLKKEERETLKQMNDALPEEMKLNGGEGHPLTPWREIKDGTTVISMTPLLDLLSLQHVLGLEGKRMEVLNG